MTYTEFLESKIDIARMAERGIYEMDTWLEGMKFLPPPKEVPVFFKAMGFETIPTSVEEVKARFKTLAMSAHPDKGGSEAEFVALQEAAEKATRWFDKKI